MDEFSSTDINLTIQPAIKPTKEIIQKLYLKLNTTHSTINNIRINDELFQEESEKQNTEAKS